MIRPWVLPVRAGSPVTSALGSEYGGSNTRRPRHKGTDYDGRIGDPVFAVDDGRATKVVRENVGAAGRRVVLEHPDGRVTGYLHLDAVRVDEGDQVGQGEQIGTIGNTGGVQVKLRDPDGSTRFVITRAAPRIGDELDGGTVIADGSHLHHNARSATGGVLDTQAEVARASAGENGPPRAGGGGGALVALLLLVAAGVAA